MLELSRYQLETTHSLELKAAAVLNVSPDHMDRYATLADYAAAKARIFARCDTAVVNADDPTWCACRAPGQRAGFSLRPRPARGLRAGDAAADGKSWLARRGAPLLPVAALKISGRHNAANALAALALGDALRLPLRADARRAARASPACRIARSGSRT